MNHPLSKLKAEAMLLKLSSEEKSALHATLMQRINASAPSAAAPRMTRSPFSFIFMPQFAMPFAALLLIVCAGAGTAFAAAGALPGSPLYAIKTNINEPVMGALAFSAQDKIDFDNQIVETRLEEAQALAAQNKLDASTTEALAANLDAHLSQRDALAAAISTQSQGTDASDDEVLDSSIAAQGDVLAQLGAQSSSGTTRDNSEALASRVRLASAAPAGGVVRAAFAMSPAERPEAAVSPTSSPAQPMVMSAAMSGGEGAATGSASSSAPAAPQAAPGGRSEQKDALALEAKATSSLASLGAQASSTSVQVSAEVAAKLQSRLAKVAAHITDGEDALAQGDYDAASRDFTEALSESVTVSTFIAAQQKFDGGILGNLLNNDSDGGDSNQ